jgi:hypothetical protein
MNAELLYTSAPQGLKQGSRGFCTVLSTQGMPINLASKLESLSGYRHVYPSGSPQDSQNPVAYSHLKFSVGGRSVSVLSRVAAYGLDYSQRTNKIAHHVVLDEPLPPSGPAALLLAPGFMRDSWDGQCQTVAAPVIPGINVQPNRCQKWESLTGDAGWGGRLAEAWLDRKGKPTFVIFSIEQSGLLLSLIAESLSLLPPSKRWQATFGTYITNLPPDVECKVRCVIAGSEEARMASARGEVIDLSRPNGLGVLPPTEGVRAAREGFVIGNALKEASNAKTSGLPGTDIQEAIEIASAFDFDDRKSGFDFDPNNPFGERHPPRLGSLSSTLPGIPPSHPSQYKRKDTQGQSKIMIVGALAICLLIVGGGIAVMFLGQNQVAQLVPKGDPDDKESTRGDAQPIEPLKPQNEKTQGNGGEVGGKSGADTGEDENQSEKDFSPNGSGNSSASEKSETDDSNGQPPNSETLDFVASDFQIEFGGFMMLDENSPDSPIPLLAGIPGASLTARLSINDSIKQTDEHKKIIDQLTSTPGIDWKWKQSMDGKEWKPLDDADQQSKGTVCTLLVTEKFQPGAQIQAIASINAPSLIKEKLELEATANARIASFREINIKKSSLFKNDDGIPRDILITIDCSDILTGKFEIHWSKDRQIIRQMNFGLLNDRMPPSTNGASRLTNFDSEVKKTQSLLNDINKHRMSIDTFLTDGIKQFRNDPSISQIRPLPQTTYLQNIREKIRENSGFSRLNWNSSWNTQGLKDLRNFFESDRSKMEQFWKDYEEKRQTNMTSAIRINLPNPSPLQLEWRWLNNALFPSQGVSTIDSEFNDLYNKFDTYKSLIKDLEVSIDLGAIQHFAIFKDGSIDKLTGATKKDFTRQIHLWTRLVVSGDESDDKKSDAILQENEIAPPKKTNPANSKIAPSPNNMPLAPATRGAPNPL